MVPVSWSPSRCIGVVRMIVQHVLQDPNPRFPLEVAAGDVVVAGKHFGQSSGRG